MTVVNYLEGTRYTAAKSTQQQSPFTHLLKPKAGGVAFVLAAMGEQLDAILDVTVVYPQQTDSGILGLDQWQRAAGHHRYQDPRTRPGTVAGRLRERPGFRQTIQNWVNHLWIEKDRRIDALRAENR